MSIPDPIDLTRRLVRCASVTPENDGAIELLTEVLETNGFTCIRADRGGIANLIARFGPKGHERTFGFNGHTDVVPPGDEAAWTYPPFSAELVDGVIWGRGATDMKSGVAAFVAAACAVAAESPDGAILLTITGDEEADAVDGTRAILDAMEDAGEVMSFCVVAEPSSTDTLGDTIKIGRRGSMNAFVSVQGMQGHSAYPNTRNPIHALTRFIHELTDARLDDGTDHFGASTMQVTTFDTGNTATNVVPAKCRASLNIRFNDLHTGESLKAMLQARADEIAEETACSFDLSFKISGEAFLTEPGPVSDMAAAAIAAETGRTPTLSTGGGTSDARFIVGHCPIIEVGLRNATIHQVDERVTASEITGLTRIFERMMRDYFAG